MSNVSELARLFECWRQGHSFEDFYVDISNALEDTEIELRRLLKLVDVQHSDVHGLRLKVLNLEHNTEVLTNALWKACGDDEQVVKNTIKSQGTLR